MKALDTSVLLAILEGEPGSRSLLKRLQGTEVATTEANLLELAILAARGPERDRRARRDALARLRHRVTVLPIEARGVDAAAIHLGRTKDCSNPSVLAMLGTLEAVGCEELLTLDPPVDYGKWRLKITRIRLNATK